MNEARPGLIVLDVGHAGKPQRPNDRGVIRGDLVEVELTWRYVLAADHELRRQGFQVLLGGSGSYESRWAQADALGALAYIQCHVNAGGGDRGEVFYDYRSTAGRALATAVATELAEAMPWPVRALRCHPDDDGEPRDEDYGEAFSCIAGVRAVALVLEPYFIDGPQTAHFITHLDAVGTALARGIAAWRPS